MSHRHSFSNSAAIENEHVQDKFGVLPKHTRIHNSVGLIIHLVRPWVSLQLEEQSSINSKLRYMLTKRKLRSPYLSFKFQEEIFSVSLIDIISRIRPLAKVRADNVCVGFSRAQKTSHDGQKDWGERERERKRGKKSILGENIKFERNGLKNQI